MQLSALDVPDRLPNPPGAGYLVLGNEPLLVMEAAAAIRAQLRDAGFTERNVMHVESGFDWGRIASQAGTLSLFAERRLIEVQIPNGKPGVEGARVLGEWFENPDPDSCLLVVATTEQTPKTDARWTRAFESEGVLVVAKPIKGRQLDGWLAARARGLGLDVEAEALRWLATQVEGNLLAAAQELAKLPLLAQSGQRIDIDLLKQAVADNARFAAYELPDRALAGDLGAALRMLGRLREEGVEPVVVIGSLARDLRSLYAAALLTPSRGADRACDAVRIWRSRKAAFVRALGAHSIAQAGEMMREAGRLDRLSKSGSSARAWEELINLTVRLAAPSGRQAA